MRTHLKSACLPVLLSCWACSESPSAESNPPRNNAGTSSSTSGVDPGSSSADASSIGTASSTAVGGSSGPGMASSSPVDGSSGPGTASSSPVDGSSGPGTASSHAGGGSSGPVTASSSLVGGSSGPGASSSSAGPGASSSGVGPTSGGDCQGSVHVVHNLRVGETQTLPTDGRPVDATLGHRVDVDVGEAGCVAGVRLRFSAHASGCPLDLEFAPPPGGGALTLVGFTWTVDAFCAGFSAASEGQYTLAPGAYAVLEDLAPVADGLALRACTPMTLRPHGRVTLNRSGGGSLEVDLSSIQVEGVWVSQGSTTAQCACRTGFVGATCQACHPRFTGPACDQCAEPYFGDACAEACADPLKTGAGCTQCISTHQDRDGNGVCQPTCAASGLGNCSGHGTCSDATGTAVCTCTDHHGGATCATCESGHQDRDGNGICTPTCANSGLGNCGGHGTCSDLSGTAACQCSPGYQGDTCTQCRDTHQDKDGNGTCLPTCASSGFGTCGGHGTCSDQSGTAVCTCTGGYTGQGCATCGMGTQDKDNNGVCTATCATSGLGTCGGHGTCSDQTGTAACTCDTGHQGTTCGSCTSGYQDRDGDGLCLPTCATAGLTGCSGHGVCSDLTGSATCTCESGWNGTSCANPGFVNVTSGALHACGLRSNGAVECWGSNTMGQATVPAGVVASGVAAGSYFTCAKLVAGGVRCWGDALGTANRPMDNEPGKPATGQFYRILAGDSFACTLADDGHLDCFGPGGASITRNNVWEAGFGTDTQAYIRGDGVLVNLSGLGSSPAPTHAAGYADLDCGTNYCCAIRETRTPQDTRLQGGVQCWGNNTPGDPFQSAGRVANAPAVTEPYAAVSAGAHAACAIRSTPTVPSTDLRPKCWGSNTDGLVSGAYNAPAVAVSVGAYHACAVGLESSAITCWGSTSGGLYGTKY